MKIVLFIGYSGSGKTSAINAVTGALKRRGRKVATIKHIHDPNFTIDTPGKDTWLHANAGASVVVALALKELTIIRKMNTSNLKLDSIMRLLKREGIDYVLVEGLYRKLYSRRNIIRVLCAASKEDAATFLKDMRPAPVCIAGRIADGHSGGSFHGVPLISFPMGTARFLRLIGRSRRSLAT